MTRLSFAWQHFNMQTDFATDLLLTSTVTNILTLTCLSEHTWFELSFLNWMKMTWDVLLPQNFIVWKKHSIWFNSTTLKQQTVCIFKLWIKVAVNTKKRNSEPRRKDNMQMQDSHFCPTMIGWRLREFVIIGDLVAKWLNLLKRL